MIDTILDLIASAIEYVVDFIIEIVDRVISFWGDIVNYFKKLKLSPKVHTPFIADGKKFKEYIKNATVIEGTGIFEGVYNEATNEIENGRYISGNDLDTQTKLALKDKGIAVLT